MKKLDVVFKALADINRVRILKILERRKMCVCELAFVLRIAQPSVSRHLKKLGKAGLIGSEQDGFWTNYYLREDKSYGRVLLGNLKGWLNDNGIVRKDLEKVKKADRRILCCRK